MLFIGAFYELIRFVLLLVLSLGIVNPGFEPFHMHFLLLISAPALVSSAGSFLAGLYPERYGVFTKLIAFGKFLGLIPLILVILGTSGRLAVEVPGLRLGGLTYLFLGVIVLDLLFFGFLVSYRVHRDHSGDSRDRNDSASSDDLPEWHETRIEE